MNGAVKRNEKDYSKTVCDKLIETESLDNNEYPKQQEMYMWLSKQKKRNVHFYYIYLTISVKTNEF